MRQRYGLPAVWLALILLTLETAAWGQSFDRQKAGVVRVTSQVEGLRRTGTGFIVGLDSDAAYIVTASHVVEGDSQPHVEFFTKRNATVQAETARIEGGDPRGLALLIVRGKDNLPAGLVALPIAQGSDLNGGEPVTVIGFPQGGGSWAVLRANIVVARGSRSHARRQHRRGQLRRAGADGRKRDRGDHSGRRCGKVRPCRACPSGEVGTGRLGRAVR